MRRTAARAADSLKAGSSRRTATILASGSAAVAAAGGVLACEGGTDGTYKYVPPLRNSTKLSAAAAEAAKPRVHVASKPTPRVLFVLGGPGAGKGTQCAKLVKEYGFVHLSAGDLLREERDSGSPDGEMIEAFIREGKIVPVEVTVNLIKKAMAKSSSSKFLVDGFPRNFNNLEGWMSVMAGSAVVDGVILYDVPEDIMVDRLLERGKTSGRSDDNIDTIRKRLRTYVDSTVPVLQHYEAKGQLSKIDGSRAIGVVYADTRAAVDPTVRAEVAAANALLLDAISAGDWTGYAALVDPAVTCFEPEAGGGLARVTGLAFHKAVFEEAAKARARAVLEGRPAGWTVSTMTDTQVTLLGPRHAMVTCVREIRPLGAPAGAAATKVAETRVWRLSDAGAWRLVHFHRTH